MTRGSGNPIDRFFPGRVPLVVLIVFSLGMGGADGQQPEPAEVSITLSSPRADEVVRNRVTMAPIRGRAESGSDAGDRDFDVMVVLDVSHSTRYPSGIDVDGDGEVGLDPRQELVAAGTYPADLVCTDSDDTILAAEIIATRHLLKILDPSFTRVGIITFSGAANPETGERLRPDQKDAVVRVPLTRNFETISSALDEILADGPQGATNFSAAIKLSVIELAGLSRAYSEPRAFSRKVVLFLTDGVPTFPYGLATQSDPADVEAAISAARFARTAGIRLNTFALGAHAMVSPLALSEMSRITLGSFTAVRNAGDIINFLQGVSFSDIEDVVVTNLSTGEISYDVELAPDGGFNAFVPVREGRNRIEVAALAGDGGEARLSFDLSFEKSGLTPRELALELERIKKRNRALMLLIERRRIEEFRARQRRRVEVGVSDE